MEENHFKLIASSILQRIDSKLGKDSKLMFFHDFHPNIKNKESFYLIERENNLIKYKLYLKMSSD